MHLGYSSSPTYVDPRHSRLCLIELTPFADGMQKVQCRAGAKVPIVKMWDPELQLACDLNVNNPLALENTRMIKTYVQIDERVRPLAKIIKYWTKRRILNDAGARSYLGCQKACTLIYSHSLRRHYQFLHMDMHDSQLLADPRSSYSPVPPEDDQRSLDPGQRPDFCIRRRSRRVARFRQRQP